MSPHSAICTSCGYIEDRDVNAAKNILVQGKGMAFRYERNGMSSALPEKPAAF